MTARRIFRTDCRAACRLAWRGRVVLGPRRAHRSRRAADCISRASSMCPNFFRRIGAGAATFSDRGRRHSRKRAARSHRRRWCSRAMARTWTQSGLTISRRGTRVHAGRLAVLGGGGGISTRDRAQGLRGQALLRAHRPRTAEGKSRDRAHPAAQRNDALRGDRGQARARLPHSRSRRARVARHLSAGGHRRPIEALRFFEKTAPGAVTWSGTPK